MKYAKNCRKGHEIWCRHSLSPDDVSSRFWWIHKSFLSPPAGWNVLFSERYPVQCQNNFKFLLGSVFYFMLWQLCAYGLVRVRKENIFWLGIPVWMATNVAGDGPTSSKKISAFFGYKLSWKFSWGGVTLTNVETQSRTGSLALQLHPLPLHLPKMKRHRHVTWKWWLTNSQMLRLFLSLLENIMF